MANGSHCVLPWLPERQLYNDANRAGNFTYSFTRRSYVTRRQTGGNGYEISVKNRWEAHWDKLIFGALSCRTGNFRENQGNSFLIFGSHKNDNDTSFLTGERPVM